MVKCDVPLSLCFHLQYACCLRYDIRRDHTAHLFTHQININYKELQTAIYKFALENSTWIEKVGRDAFARAKLTVQDYTKCLHNGTVFFDELCILITCCAFNVHCVVLLDGAYWSTCPNNVLHDCLIKIAYVGNFGFKEIQTKLYHTLNDEASQEYASEPESCSDDNLQGTGLNVDGKTSMETSEQENLQNQNSEQDQDQNQNEQNEETLDVKPMVRHLITFTSSQN